MRPELGGRLFVSDCGVPPVTRANGTLIARELACRWGLRRLQPLWRGYAEQAEAVGQNDPRGVSQPQPRSAETIEGPVVTG